MLVFWWLYNPIFVHADTADDLQSKINDHTATIQQLQAEISQYQSALATTTVQAKTLQDAVKSLDLNSKKIGTSIKLTQAQIDAANLTIQKLALSISDKETKIKDDQRALGSTMRTVNEDDGQPFIETFLLNSSLSTFSDELETIGEFQSSMKDGLDTLEGLKKDLVVNQNQTQVQKGSLVTLASTLSDQKTSIELTKQQKAALLSATKDKESAYQKIIAQKKLSEQEFETELNQYQAQLHLTVNPSSLPGAVAGVLAWPVSPHIVTQYFGNTAFAGTHSQLYSGQGHDGLDIGVPIGTSVHAAAAGVVLGTGNTDLTCPGASFGKWVMIKHADGLSTMYAHLSLIKATTGQVVSTGDIIGLSGMTGYATGPHLHFGVYATDGTEITSFASKGCKGHTYTMPVAALSAYLNPLSFLGNDYTTDL